MRSPGTPSGRGSRPDGSSTTYRTRARYDCERWPAAPLGVFGEGSMRMFNAIVPDHLLHALGLFKERLSQSALYAEVQTVSERSARAHLSWLGDRDQQVSRRLRERQRFENDEDRTRRELPQGDLRRARRGDAKPPDSTEIRDVDNRMAR